MRRSSSFLSRSTARRSGAVVPLWVLLVFSVFAPAAGAVDEFSDVPANKWYTKPVEWALSADIIDDTTNTFRPTADATRLTAALWLWRAQGEPGAPPHPFSDVPSGVADADKAISWLRDAQITKGTSATTFSPDRSLTRGELATFLWRLEGKPEAPPHPFNDIERGWQQQPVSWLSHAKVTTGTSPTTFSPDNQLSRAQLITFIWRYNDEPSPVGSEPASPTTTTVPATTTTRTVPTTTTTTVPVSADCKFSDRSKRVLSAVWQVRTGDSIGTAFYIGNDEWLTAAHVVEGETSVKLHHDGRSLNATILGGDRDADIAVLSAPGSGVTPLAFSDLDSLSAGEELFVVGFPVYVAAEPSVTRGVLSRIETDDDLGTIIQTDASANGGNSGGPLVDECGNVAGMIVIKLVANDIEGIAYAIAETTLQERIPGYRSAGPESIVAERSYTECFGSSSASEWNSDWSVGAHDWDYVVWRHKTDGRKQGGVYVDASRHTLNNYRNALPEGCDFTPWLSMSCTANKKDSFSVQVWWAGITTNTADRGAVTVTYRIDNGTSANSTWRAWDDDSTYLENDGSVEFVNRLSRSRTLVFQGQDSSGTTVIDATFDITGVDDALEHLQDTCNWSSPQPPSATPAPQPVQQVCRLAARFCWETSRGSTGNLSASTDAIWHNRKWPYDDDWAVLAVVCFRERQDVEVKIQVESGYLAGDVRTDLIPVSYVFWPVGSQDWTSAQDSAHIDQNAIHQRWDESPSNTSAWLWEYADVQAFINEAVNGGEVQFSILNFNGESFGGFEFNLVGSYEPIRQVTEECGWTWS